MLVVYGKLSTLNVQYVCDTDKYIDNPLCNKSAHN